MPFIKLSCETICLIKAALHAVLIIINHLHYDAHFNITYLMFSYLGYYCNENREQTHHKVIYAHARTHAHTHRAKFCHTLLVCNMNSNNFYLTLLFTALLLRKGGKSWKMPYTQITAPGTPFASIER